MTQKTSLVLASKSAVKGFQEAVKAEYVKKYAQDVVVMIEDQKKLQKALNTVTEAIRQVEAGNYDAIAKYKSKRKRLEYEDDVELD